MNKKLVLGSLIILKARPAVHDHQINMQEGEKKEREPEHDPKIGF